MSRSNKVVIAGASGLVGARVLERLLQDSSVEYVTAVGRRPLPLQHERLESKVVDLRNADEIAAALPTSVSVAVCCLGTTMKQAGSKEAFRAVDHDAVVAFARAARARGVERFVLVSSIGASPRAGSFYLKVKGEAEEAVQTLGYRQVTILRSSFIDDQGTRHENRPAERWLLPVLRALFALIGKRRRFAPVPVDVLAEAVTRIALDGTGDGVRIFESERLHALGARPRDS